MVFGDILQRYSTQYKYTVQGILYRLLDQSTHSEYTVHIHSTGPSLGSQCKVDIYSTGFIGSLVTYYRDLNS